MVQDSTPRKIPFVYSFSGNGTASVPISTFMFLWANYVYSCCRIDTSIVGINKSLTDTWMWKNWDCGRTITFLGIFVSNFRVLFLYSECYVASTEKNKYFENKIPQYLLCNDYRSLKKSDVMECGSNGCMYWQTHTASRWFPYFNPVWACAVYNLYLYCMDDVDLYQYTFCRLYTMLVEKNITSSAIFRATVYTQSGDSRFLAYIPSW
jgi:hypothetical protein